MTGENLTARADRSAKGKAPRAPRPGRPRGISAFTWAVWPWMNWLLPAFFIFHGYLDGTGGWMTLALAFASPLLLPAFGLLGSLPRFILRRRGATATPGPIIWLLFLHGWGWVGAALAMQDTTDSSIPPPTLLQGLGAGALSAGAQAAIFLAALAVVSAAWLAVLVLAIVLPPDRPPHRGWRIAGWVSAFATPLLLAAAVMLAGFLTLQQTDGAGETVAEVQERPVDEQAERMLERHEHAQRSLSEVRALIAEDGWQPEWAGGDDCGRVAGVPCYQLAAAFGTTSTAGIPAGLDEELADLGWTVTDADAERIEATRDDLVLTVGVWGDDALIAGVLTPWWWGDEIALRERLNPGRDRPAEPADGYSADEWPPLD